MDRAVILAVFAAADARFDPCGAAAFAERLGGELDAGRIAFPMPLVIGSGRPKGCLVLDRFPAELTGLAQAARILARGLADLGGAAFEIGLCGEPIAAARALVTEAVALEMSCRRQRFEPVTGPVHRCWPRTSGGKAGPTAGAVVCWMVSGGGGP